MKKKFKDTKVGMILGGILKGALGDTILPIAGTVVGAVSGAKETIKKIKQNNLEDELGGQGKVNYVRLLSTVAMIGFALMFAFGKINSETFERLIELFNFD